MIANQDAPELERFRSNSGTAFSFLIDEGAKVIRSYGVVNEEKEALPHPATFILDEDGVVLYRNVNPNYKERPEVQDLLLTLANR